MADESVARVGKVAFSKAHVELKKEDVLAFKNLKVGSRVRVVLEGEIKGLSADKVDGEADGAQHGTVDLTVKSMKVSGSNEFSDLAEE